MSNNDTTANLLLARPLMPQQNSSFGSSLLNYDQNTMSQMLTAQLMVLQNLQALQAQQDSLGLQAMAAQLSSRPAPISVGGVDAGLGLLNGFGAAGGMFGGGIVPNAWH